MIKLTESFGGCKDVNSNLDLEELGKVQKLDKTRACAYEDDDMQRIGAFNGNRHWDRPVMQYLNHRNPLEVHKFAAR